MSLEQLTVITRTFLTELSLFVDEMATRHIQRVLANAFASRLDRSVGVQQAATERNVRQRPKQRCPIPGCKNPAAPVFGMVCKVHKDVPKETVRRYRAERRGDFTHLTGTSGSNGKAPKAQRRKLRRPKRTRPGATKPRGSGRRKTARRIIRKKTSSTRRSTPPQPTTASSAPSELDPIR